VKSWIAASVVGLVLAVGLGLRTQTNRDSLSSDEKDVPIRFDRDEGSSEHPTFDQTMVEPATSEGAKDDESADEPSASAGTHNQAKRAEPTASDDSPDAETVETDIQVLSITREPGPSSETAKKGGEESELIVY